MYCTLMLTASPVIADLVAMESFDLLCFHAKLAVVNDCSRHLSKTTS